ncbi:hypothetical protein F4781DRAFT_367295 [Annulohypoxylon bovei var. microspora]|nr:hypothetical protein F4781DRAFT_367295 [Annulohypoxylon bovei var. microspora]
MDFSLGYSCAACNVYFATLDELCQHWLSGVGQDYTHRSCPPCCRQWPTLEGQVDHLANRSYHNVCSHCSHDFRDERSAYDAHILKLRVCPFPICNNKLFDRNLIASHLYNIHRFCPTCKTSFPTEEILKNHRTGSTGHS